MIECSILNRLRGTGVIKHFGTLNVGVKKIEVKLVWNHIYGMYLGLIFGLLAMNVWCGLAMLVAYLVGESKGWGEWVGALTRWEGKDEEWLNKQYVDNEGVGFPYVHKITNAIVKENIEGTLEERLDQYDRYAKVALAIRGMFWWGLVYGVAATFGVVSVVEAVVITVALGVGFPIACWVGKKLKYGGSVGVIHFSRGWENQELVYGLMQGMCLWYVVMGVL